MVADGDLGGLCPEHVGARPSRGDSWPLDRPSRLAQGHLPRSIADRPELSPAGRGQFVLAFLPRLQSRGARPGRHEPGTGLGGSRTLVRRAAGPGDGARRERHQPGRSGARSAGDLAGDDLRLAVERGRARRGDLARGDPSRLAGDEWHPRATRATALRCRRAHHGKWAECSPCPGRDALAGERHGRTRVLGDRGGPDFGPCWLQLDRPSRPARVAG
ncbi:MAG: hypothetical protein KatS3mg061_0924 [Dehalococcoidia bacterium]|nr:MAG: hypothetical protein KatS3mg061_0924 [Dehalococcoidia bacterium]